MAFSPIRPVTTGTYTTNHSVTPSTADTVDDLRHEIRAAVVRHERVESTAFTKEALAAICEAVGYDIGEGGLPSKARMRAGVLGEVGELPADDPDEADRPLRKAELDAVASALRDEQSGN